MTGVASSPSPEAVARFLDRVAAVLGAISVDGFSVADASMVLAACERHRRALAALEAKATGIVSKGSVPLGRDRLRTGLGISTAEAGRRSRVAEAVAALPSVGEALAAGMLSEAHVDGVAAARSIAGERLDAEVPVLLELALRCGADEFATKAREFARHLVADHGEAHSEKQRRQRSLRWWTTDEGMTRLSGDLDPESAAAICGAVTERMRSRWSTANPSGHAERNGECESVDARRVDALVNLCSRAAPSAEPTEPTEPTEPACSAEPAEPGSNESDGTGQQAPARSEWASMRLPSVAILIDYETLVEGLRAGSICEFVSGEPLAVSTARRLACDADVYPVVLGSARAVLDLGRSQRLVNRSQRRALGIRDKGCVEPGCTAPIEWCDAHHVIDWWGPRRGPTDLDNLVLLCRHHHTLLHRGLWTLPPDIVERAERCLARHRNKRTTSAGRSSASGRGAPP